MASSPHFFKIVLQHSLRDRKMKLPKKLVQEYGKCLSNHVRLEVPNGDEWRVGLTRVEGMVWLQNGWHQFAQHYSLELGSFLVFRYNASNSSFHVMIFHKCGMEIDYPCKVGDDDADDDDSVIILDSFPEKREKKKTSLPSLQPQPGKKKMRNAYLKVAEAGTGSNPSFEVDFEVKQYKGGAMCIPLSFVRKHLSQELKQQIARLQIEDKEWKVKLLQGKGMFRFSAGWCAFLKDNCLKDRDRILFELISILNCTFKVTIRRKII